MSESPEVSGTLFLLGLIIGLVVPVYCGIAIFVAAFKKDIHAEMDKAAEEKS